MEPAEQHQDPMEPAEQHQADPHLGLLRERIRRLAPFKFGMYDAEAEDLAQDVVMVLLNRFRDKNDPAELMRIALGILTRLNIEIWRKRRRRGELNPLDVDAVPLCDGRDDPEEKIMKMQRAELVAKAIVDLGEPCRTILRMQLSEASTEEVMSAVGARTPNALYLQASRCREKLGEKIKKLGGALVTRP